MQVTTLRLSNFQSFGPEPTEVTLEDISFLIGPNGSGKTTVLQALSRMFGFDPKQRYIRKSDFHISTAEEPTNQERQLWIEAEFRLPELVDDGQDHPTVPPQFGHMRLQDGQEQPIVRFRLNAKMDIDGDIQEEMHYVNRSDENNEPIETSIVPNLERKNIQVHYLPARRDPADHITYGTNTLLGRLLRSADWAEKRAEVQELTQKVSATLVENNAISEFSNTLTTQWKRLHKGDFFREPSITFASTEMESLLRHLSVSFSPAHEDDQVDFSRLSDGQKSLLYLSLVLTTQAIGRKLQGSDCEGMGFDPDKLRPATFTIVAIEEPENSLSPYYLGRIFSSLKEMVKEPDAQAIIATHAPPMLRRVEPEKIRYLRLNEERITQVTKIIMPPKKGEARKFVREAIQAFPEVYFSRLVILGEGDSEEIVLPRILKAKGIPVDEHAICVAPLGGRHVNHFWRLLSALQIPYITLLDLDLARHQAGWGRIKVANDNLRKFNPDKILPDDYSFPKWNDDKHLCRNFEHYFEKMEQRNVFFSNPLDLDFSLINAYADAYGIEDDDLVEPSKSKIKAVLGDSYHGVEQYSPDEQLLFSSYHSLFKVGSKPAAHFTALGSLSDADLIENMPPELDRLADKAKEILEGLPE